MDYPDYVNEYYELDDYRYWSGSPTDSQAVHLAPGQTFVRNFDYEMGKLVVTYTITGSTPAQRLLRSPRLYFGSLNPTDYAITPFGIAAGTDVITEQGKVTAYLPKGFYWFAPFAIRQLDGSTVAFPEMDFTIGGCTSIDCDVNAPQSQWVPQADSCGGPTGTVSGTAHDSDGFTRIGYRVNYSTPSPSDLTGYTMFTLIPTAADHDVTFSAPLTLNEGANTVEWEAVDALGHRCYEQRTVYRSTGTPPTLDWTVPPDGLVTDQSTVEVQGSASAGVKIDFVNVGATPMALAPVPGSSNPHDRTFSQSYVLATGANTITLQVCDVCALCVEETRTVTRTINHPPTCDAGGPYSVPAGGSVVLHGAGSGDPDGDTLQYSWTTDCPGGAIGDRFSVAPTLTVGTPPLCACSVSLVINDPSGATAACSSAVTLLCDDGLYCNGVETCDPTAGCVTSNVPNCTDGIACTLDVCNEQTHSCEHAPSNAACDDGLYCAGVETCDPASGCLPGTPPSCDDGIACTLDSCNEQTHACDHTPNNAACDDGNPCSDDTCDPTSGCRSVPNDACRVSPKTQGFWKRLCVGHHPEGSITQTDVECVNDSCTFASVHTISDLCDRLTPNPPNDKCEQAEAQFMSLMLNHCQGRLTDIAPILSQCTSNTTVGLSRADADALLCSATRNQATCTVAQCESEELNTGRALLVNSLRVVLLPDGSVRLTWDPPYGLELGTPRAYIVRRRTSGETAYQQLASTQDLFYVDTTAGEGGFYQYEVTPVW